MSEVDTLELLRFRVDGRAVSQGNHSVFHGRVVEKTKGLKQWREAVAAAAVAAAAGRPPFTDAVVLNVTFFLPRGKTVKRKLPTAKPDLDKLVRAVDDALTASKVWSDDALVVCINARKLYADEHDEPHANVVIYAYHWTEVS